MMCACIVARILVASCRGGGAGLRAVPLNRGLGLGGAARFRRRDALESPLQQSQASRTAMVMAFTCPRAAYGQESPLIQPARAVIQGSGLTRVSWWPRCHGPSAAWRAQATRTAPRGRGGGEALSAHGAAIGQPRDLEVAKCRIGTVTLGLAG